MHITPSKKGFTLIELLVVVSIIALLVSILLPALSKAREQTKAAVCLSNLRQMSLGMHYYAEANNDRAMVFTHTQGGYWFLELAPLLGDKLFQDDPESRQKSKVMDIVICPSTQKREYILNVSVFGTAKKLWRFFDAQGSYGMNLWITRENPGPANDYYDYAPLSSYTDNIWERYSSIKPDAPEFGDSPWVGSWPFNDSNPPQIVPNDLTGEAGEILYPHNVRNFTGRFCIDRHNMAVNMAFHDGHAEKVPLENLWTLRWHKNSVPNYDVVVP